RRQHDSICFGWKNGQFHDTHGIDRCPLRYPASASNRYSRRLDHGRTPADIGRNGHHRSEEHTSELQSRGQLVCRLLLEKKKPQDHADGLFIIFDTLTLADDLLEASYATPNACRDYFRDIVPLVLAAEGRKANASDAACY